MKLRAEFFLAAEPENHLVGKLFRFQRTQAYPADPLLSAGGLHSVAEVQPQILAVSGEVDPGEHYLPVAMLRKLFYLRTDFLQRL